MNSERLRRDREGDTKTVPKPTWLITGYDGEGGRDGNVVAVECAVRRPVVTS